MKSKIFYLSTKKYNYKVSLKIEIDKEFIITSFKHGTSTEFTNNRRFLVEQLNFAFDTLKPILDIKELIDVEDFMFDKPEGTQMSLF